MKKLILISALFTFFSCANQTKNNLETVLDLVDPFIGTGGHGHTFPGATTPFGMVQLSPDTRLDGWDGCSGYHYTDSIIYGFSHTHLSGTGVADYCDLLITPHNAKHLNLEDCQNRRKTASAFDKQTEKASPGYYGVYLKDAEVKVELTSAPRVGIHRYTFKYEPQILLDLNHRDQLIDFNFKVLNDSTIIGYRVSRSWARQQHFYFALRSNHPFTTEKPDEKSPYLNLIFSSKSIEIKVAMSTTDTDGALLNLTETQFKTFDDVLTESRELWKRELEKIKVFTSKQEDLIKFYTSLYHTCICPNLISDLDGKYRGMDQEIHISKRPVYTVFSLWDTFRATHPLFTITQPERTRDFAATFLNQYRQGKRLPVWELSANETDCMIGYHSVSVIWDAVSKGLVTDSLNELYEAMKSSAFEDHFGLKYYKKKGYISSEEEPESVSKTLEYAYDDWCIAEMASHLGLKEEAALFYKRSESYKNLFDPETNFFRAKINGSWLPGFDPTEVNFNYTEANAWQYSLFAPHNIHDLVKMHGGAGNFEAHLDKLFNTNVATSGRHQVDITGLIGQYAHGNEPSHHMAYLYNYIGKPEKTQEKIRQILSEQYTTLPDGLSGNEDCGQMSAWYVLSAMGLYSVTPGMPNYQLGYCIFDSVQIRLDNGNLFTIHGNRLSNKTQGFILNNQKIKTHQISHAELSHGGLLKFSDDNSSYIEEHKVTERSFVSVPFFDSNGSTFGKILEVKLSGVDPESRHFIKINESPFVPYQEPMLLTVDSKILAFSKIGELCSDTIEGKFYKVLHDKNIELIANFSNQYAAGGKNALVDGLRGGDDYRTGRWQGYEGQDFEAIISLDQPQNIKSIEIGALQDIKSWIWYPKKIEISALINGEFKAINTIINDVPIDREGAIHQNFNCKINIQTNQIKIKASNRGVCPDWHLGAGGITWMFFDEISLKY